MPDLYPVVTVQPEWVLGPEEMGSKTKFWYNDPQEGDANWLFKHPKPKTGEHWAEKIAEQVADVLQMAYAKVELAEFQGQPGSVSKSFTSETEELRHGNEVLEQVVPGYDPNKKFHQSSHTADNIFRSMDETFISPDAARQAKIDIAGHLVLDALIGNTDRHHENWGILQHLAGDQWKGAVAPSFDHASSLGRELLDERRDRLLAEENIGKYVERGRGGIYWSEDEKRAPSPLELVRRAVQSHPDLFRPALENLQKLDEEKMQTVVSRVPDSWMTPSAREFSVALIRYNFEQLGGLV